MTAASYLELGWLLIGIILAGLAFFFDGPITAMGLHIPTLVLVVIVIYGNSHLGNFYPLIEPTAPASAPLSPEEVIDALFPLGNGKDSDRILTIVCASGGGIEASAWTARVLTSLEKEFHPSFANSIGLISSVSGGSVGAMYYLDHRYRTTTPHLIMKTLSTQRRCRALSAALWGLIGPDTFRFLTYGLPIRYSKIDRGWALEQVWRGAPTSLNRKAADYRRKILELAQRLASRQIACGGLQRDQRLYRIPGADRHHRNPQADNPQDGKKPDPSTPENVIQIGDGEGQYGNADIAAATAARLSASFPYVTPVATGFCSDGRQCPDT